uniref:Uncharacterized protein n=1 Tax=Anguilla anguilla TaxID=7936 RepID=A0A0E9PFN1_ANGAN
MQARVSHNLWSTDSLLDNDSQPGPRVAWC